MDDSPVESSTLVTTLGLEITVQGLNHDTSTAARMHLKDILLTLEQQGESFPPLNIVSASSVAPLDYVHISLSGKFRE